MAEIIAPNEKTFFLELPIPIIEAIEAIQQKRGTGQLLINFNRGEAQSFEVKEHYRL